MAILSGSCTTLKPIDPLILLMSTEGRGFESRSQQQSALWAKVEFRFRAVPYRNGKLDHSEQQEPCTSSNVLKQLRQTVYIQMIQIDSIDKK